MGAIPNQRKSPVGKRVEVPEKGRPEGRTKGKKGADVLTRGNLGRRLVKEGRRCPHRGGPRRKRASVFLRRQVEKKKGKKALEPHPVPNKKEDDKKKKFWKKKRGGRRRNGDKPGSLTLSRW